MNIDASVYPIALALGAVCLAAIIDLATHRIPNKLTAPVVLAGLMLQAWLHGLNGLLDGFLGVLSAFMFFLPFYLFRWIAAGDVKLVMAVGACLGWRLGILTGLTTMLLGSLVAFVFLLVKGELLLYLRRYGLMAKCLLLTGHFAYMPPNASDSASLRFPYALVIALGTWGAIYGPGLWSFMRIPILSGG